MERVTDIPERVVQAAADAVAEIRVYLASEEGRRLRQRVATGLVFAAPAIARLPWMRASRLGRFVGMAGGSALIVKLADVIRDWEPVPRLDVAEDPAPPAL